MANTVKKLIYKLTSLTRNHILDSKCNGTDIMFYEELAPYSEKNFVTLDIDLFRPSSDIVFSSALKSFLTEVFSYQQSISADHHLFVTVNLFDVDIINEYLASEFGVNASYILLPAIARFTFADESYYTLFKMRYGF